MGDSKGVFNAYPLCIPLPIIAVCTFHRRRHDSKAYRLAEPVKELLPTVGRSALMGRTMSRPAGRRRVPCGAGEY